MWSTENVLKKLIKGTFVATLLLAAQDLRAYLRRSHSQLC